MSHTRPGPRRRVAIVGGGVSGLSIAAQLAQAGFAVTLLEASDLGRGASTRNQGWLYSGAWFAPQSTQLARQCYRSLQQTLEFCPECVEPGHDGMIFLLLDPASETRRWTSAWEAAALPHDELDRADVQRRFSDIRLSDDCRAWQLPDRAIRPEVLLQKLASAARAAGTVIRAHSPVSQLIVEDGCVAGVATATGEAIRSDAVVLATGVASPPLLEAAGIERGIEQTTFVPVNLKSHLIAVRPALSSWPLCVLDRDGFNHVPHGATSVFGDNRWAVVRSADEIAVDSAATNLLRNRIHELFPLVELSDPETREWSGVTVQAMHYDQIEPGRVTQPTVIDHQDEPPHLANLFSVYPGRATLWGTLAADTVRAIAEKLRPERGDETEPCRANPRIRGSP